MHPQLRLVWDEPRPPGAPVRVWRDLVLVAVLLPAVALETALRPDLPHPWVSFVLGAGLVPCLLWRRTHPLTVVCVVFGASAVASLVTSGVPPEPSTMVYVLLVPYALFRWGSGREALLGSLVMLARLAVGALLGEHGAADLVGGAAILVAVCALGGTMRYRSRARQRDIDRIELLERESLARDLHDTVAHHVSAIAIRAQAGIAVAATSPDAAVDALRVIEAEASRTLAEMRAMVRVLRRESPAELEPAPGIRAVTSLASTGPDEAGGPVVEVSVEGDVDDVPPSVAAAVHRMAQEAVTNARRHARAAHRISVSVTADAGAVRLQVSDDGEPVSLRGTSSGYGLAGMRERAELLGGTCEAGPGRGRGWTVTAVLPRAGWAP